MVLHIGGDTIILTQDVVAIIDVETANTSKEMRHFFDGIRREFEKNSMERCKSYVITAAFDKRGRNLKKDMPGRNSAIHCSTISSSTLYKRCGFIERING